VAAAACADRLHTAVLSLYELLAGAEGAQVVVVATDERQAGLTFRIAVRMVELHPELEARVQLYHDHMTVPARGSSFYVLRRCRSGWKGWTTPSPWSTKPAGSTRKSTRW